MGRFLPALVLPLLFSGVRDRPAGAADPPPSPDTTLDRSHRALYEKVRPAVVAIRSRGPLGDAYGSGVVIDRDGTILTASSVVGRGAENIRVWLAGPRVATARLIGVRPEDECALIRIERGDLTPLALGDSDAVAVGQRVYSIGNAENALVNDDQASVSVGVVSGLYGVREERMGSTYTGRVLETTAAVNPGIEGGALVDADGRLIGMLVLNYSPLRWLGVAIPINTLKPVIEDLRKEAKPPEAAADRGPAPGAAAYFGAEFDPGPPAGEGLALRSVASEGPAEAAGLAPGDRILEIAGKKVRTPAEFTAELKRFAPGALVWLKVDLGGAVREVKVKLGEVKGP